METEKVTMKESEIEALVNDQVEKKVAAMLEGKDVEKKINALIEEHTNPDIKDQLKEQMADALKAMKVPDKELETAEEQGKKFKSFGEYLLAIRNYRLKKEADQRLFGMYIDKEGKFQKDAGHMEEGEDSQGGFLVPEVYRPDLKLLALENSVIRPNGPMVIPPIKTDSIKIPYVDDTSHESTVFGGVWLKWTGERVEKTETKPTFGQLELTPHKLAGVTYTSNELLADSAIALEPLIKRMFGQASGYAEDDVFINGTGAGQPQGILNCNCTLNINRNTASHVYFEDLTEMYASMFPSSHSRAIWLINPSVLPDIIAMGAGSAAPASGHNCIWISRDMGATKKIPGTIFGRPFFITEKMQGLGTAGDIGYFDLSYYLIWDRQPITIDVSTHIGFLTDETCWRFVIRVAGRCWPQSAMTLRNSAAPITQISPFVILAAGTS